MNKDQFDRFISGLQQNFRSYYTNGQVGELWELVQHMVPLHMQQVIKNFEGRTELPTIKDFKNEMENLGFIKRKKVVTKPIGPCKLCDNSGWVNAVVRKRNKELAFRCVCSKGESLPDYVKKYDPALHERLG
jgi:hypothetical protein